MQLFYTISARRNCYDLSIMAKPASVIRTYYYLTKPGIIFGNLLTAAAGFFLASRGEPDLSLGLPMLAGLGLVIASACVFNNVMDRRVDALMARTRRRALVRGTVKPGPALVYGTILGFCGFALLVAYTNLLATWLAAAGFLIYLLAYGFTKRRWPLGTVVGSFAGAVPPVVGYTAVTCRFDSAALILFGILVLWQMPHFYSIAIFRLDDYKSARIPVLPARRGTGVTKIYILMYIIAFALVAPLLTPLGYTGLVYLTVAGILALSWLYLALQGLRATNDTQWARRMFGWSLIVITTLSATIALGHN
jgi:heme o synthase